MAKLFYDTDLGNILIRADDDKRAGPREIEVTPEQATALAAGHIATALSNLYEAVEEISHNLLRGKRDQL